MSGRYVDALESQQRALAWLSSRVGQELLARYASEPSMASVSRGSLERMIAGPLRDGAPYHWAPAMCELLIAVSERIPPVTLAADLLPTSAGWFWLSAPLPWPDELDGHPCKGCQAIGWQLLASSDDVLALMVVPWVLMPVPGAGYHRDRSRVDYALMPTSIYPWPIGETHEQAAAETAGGPGMTDDDRAQVALLLRWMAAALVLLNQRILIAPEQQADRGARRRLEKAGRPAPAIRVVELRRTRVVEQGAEGEERAVEWSCSWVVRGHWRQARVGPKRQQLRPVWIAPYVKGPAEKPLKTPDATVFAVRR